MEPQSENFVERQWDEFWKVVSNDIQDELASACNQHKLYNSAHEAYSVILEEVDEFWDQVKLKRSLRSKLNMRKELLQIAVTAIRAIHDLRLTYEGKLRNCPRGSAMCGDEFGCYCQECWDERTRGGKHGR